MHRETGRSSLANCQRHDDYWSIISDLLVLIQCVKIGIRTSELASEFHGCDQLADNSFILDDVTPRYAIINAALDACHAGLCESLRSVLKAKPSDGAN
jgi:hypothetical protein